MSESTKTPHRYDSGVYHDTGPGDAIGCCTRPPSDPVHDVPCPQCGNVHGVTYDCVLYARRDAR
jgi:hypothetical protein